MSDPFVAEIRMFGFSFPPKGWAFCNGQLLPLSQNTALFSLLGTVYGGDGKSTFALPNLQGSVPMQPGQGPGLSARYLGEMSGSEFITLIESEIPNHTHSLVSSESDANSRVPTNRMPAGGVGVGAYAPLANTTTMALNAASVAGGSLPHNNLMPTLAVNFCIALQGTFPPRP
jgi:microcystin-dependent protein